MSDSPPSGRSLSALVVEDESVADLGLSQYLQQLGHVVVGHAATAEEAKRLYRERLPNLVLMDIRLKGADGIDLAKELLGERRVAMIIVSAYSEPDLIARAGESGVFGYLIKPVSRDALAAQIAVATQRFHDQERLRQENEQLLQTLETRKLVERAKGIFMKRLNLTEPEAHRRLQMESQKRRIPLADLARKVIESEDLLGGSSGGEPRE